ncbi:MAG: DinB family protein [Blastocatellia bacterium]|nr:DinB family protein [Blastocatellia bacterium]
MEPAFYIQRLESNRTVVEHLLVVTEPEQAPWKPAPDKWSLLEVVNHLYDEERDDFRKRLSLLLQSPDLEWPRIDPPQWAIDRKYNERDLAESVRNFLNERDNSLVWLQTLKNPDWEATYHHPQGFVIRAGDLLAAWVGHDLLHIRQLARLHWDYLRKSASPFTPDYAGEW